MVGMADMAVVLDAVVGRLMAEANGYRSWWFGRFENQVS